MVIVEGAEAIAEAVNSGRAREKEVALEGSLPRP